MHVSVKNARLISAAINSDIKSVIKVGYLMTKLITMTLEVEQEYVTTDEEIIAKGMEFKNIKSEIEVECTSLPGKMECWTIDLLRATRDLSKDFEDWYVTECCRMKTN